MIFEKRSTKKGGMKEGEQKQTRKQKKREKKTSALFETARRAKLSGFRRKR